MSVKKHSRLQVKYLVKSKLNRTCQAENKAHAIFIQVSFKLLMQQHGAIRFVACKFCIYVINGLLEEYVINFILKRVLAVNKLLLLRITFLKICRLLNFEFTPFMVNLQLWLIQQLLILQYNIQSRPSLPVSVV